MATPSEPASVDPAVHATDVPTALPTADTRDTLRAELPPFTPSSEPRPPLPPPPPTPALSEIAISGPEMTAKRAIKADSMKPAQPQPLVAPTVPASTAAAAASVVVRPASPPPRHRAAPVAALAHTIGDPVLRLRNRISDVWSAALTSMRSLSTPESRPLSNASRVPRSSAASLMSGHPVPRNGDAPADSGAEPPRPMQRMPAPSAIAPSTAVETTTDTDVVYENQRSGLYGSFSAWWINSVTDPRGKWSSADGVPMPPKEGIRLPSDRWQWVGDWQCTIDASTDAEGWQACCATSRVAASPRRRPDIAQYAFSWIDGNWQPCVRAASFVRRRRWSRMRRMVVSDAAAAAREPDATRDARTAALAHDRAGADAGSVATAATASSPAALSATVSASVHVQAAPSSYAASARSSLSLLAAQLRTAIGAAWTRVDLVRGAPAGARASADRRSAPVTLLASPRLRAHARRFAAAVPAAVRAAAESAGPPVHGASAGGRGPVRGVRDAGARVVVVARVATSRTRRRIAAVRPRRAAGRSSRHGAQLASAELQQRLRWPGAGAAAAAAARPYAHFRLDACPGANGGRGAEAQRRAEPLRCVARAEPAHAARPGAASGPSRRPRDLGPRGRRDGAQGVGGACSTGPVSRWPAAGHRRFQRHGLLVAAGVGVVGGGGAAGGDGASSPVVAVTAVQVMVVMFASVAAVVVAASPPAAPLACTSWRHRRPPVNVATIRVGPSVLHSAIAIVVRASAHANAGRLRVRPAAAQPADASATAAPAPRTDGVRGCRSCRPTRP